MTIDLLENILFGLIFFICAPFLLIGAGLLMGMLGSVVGAFIDYIATEMKK